MADLVKENLYEVLGVEESADKKQILKAYRKRALKCHPDKNPDNPKAAEEFHLLSKALEVLTDAAARAAYDKLRQARKAAQARTNALDSKRRKLKEDLEARELAAQNVTTERKKQYENRTAEQILRSEIERLRKEGSSILKQEQEDMLRQMKEDASGKGTSTCRIRLRWNGKASKQYTEQELEDIFSKHGSVVTVLISSKKTGSALLELQPSSRAKSYLHEVGVAENPLRVTMIGQEDVTSQKVPETSNTKECRKPTPSFNEDFESSVLGKMIAAQRAKEAEAKNNESSTECEKPPEASSHEDRTAEAPTFTPPDLTFDKPPAPYESVLAADARRRAERQRLIEQMMKEDDES